MTDYRDIIYDVEYPLVIITVNRPLEFKRVSG